MCGDFEEDSKLEDVLYDRYQAHAKRLLERQAGQSAPEDGVVAAIDALFTAALGRAVKDTEGATDTDRYEMLSMQPLVFARLAGYLAGHLALQEDPLHKVMDALMHGYREAGEAQRNHDHDHHHDNDHSHDHSHGHGHHPH
ncbi:MAG: hypothetical protein AB7F96_21930 [Beijerinckiaceae bacterium]